MIITHRIPLVRLIGVGSLAAFFLILCAASAFADEPASTSDDKAPLIYIIQGSQGEFDTLFLYDRIESLDEFEIDMRGQRICFSARYGFRAREYGRFLEITYGPRGGLGYHHEKYALLCVTNGQLHAALDQCSLEHALEPAWACRADTTTSVENDDKLWEYDYSLRWNGPGGDTVELVVKQHHAVISECTPDSNLDRTDTLILKFDPANGVFFTSIDTITGYFRSSFADSTTRGEYREHVVCPRLEFGAEGPRWYIAPWWYWLESRPNDTEVNVYCRDGYITCLDEEEK